MFFNAETLKLSFLWSSNCIGCRVCRVRGHLMRQLSPLFWPRRLSRAGRKIWVIKTNLFSGNWQLVELRGKPRDDDTGSGSLLGGALAGNWSSALLMDLSPTPKATPQNTSQVLIQDFSEILYMQFGSLNWQLVPTHRWQYLTSSKSRSADSFSLTLARCILTNALMKS